MKVMKIGIMGSGAVGSFFGSFLTASGHDVIYIARGAHLIEMKRNGLTIFKNNEKITVSGTFSDTIDDLMDCDLILFCVKSGNTKETAEKLKSVIRPSTLVMTLQNGIMNEEILEEVFGKERVLSAAVYVQASVQSPGVIKQSGRYKLVIGGLYDSQKKTAEDFEKFFNEAQIPTVCSRNIMLRKWKKYLFSLMFNPLSAVTDTTIGTILDNQELKGIAQLIGEETIQMANLLGYPLTQEDIKISFQNAEFARTHKTSMLQDIQSGKVSEADEMVGYLIREAKKFESNVNTMKIIYSLLKVKESHSKSRHSI